MLALDNMGPMKRSETSKPSTESALDPVLGANELVELPRFGSIAVADPDDPAATALPANALVLAVGTSEPVLRALIEHPDAPHLAGLVARQPGDRVAADSLRSVAAEHRVGLWWLPAGTSWTQLHDRLSEELSARPVAADEALADLAQTIATLTGGLVTIEDTSARVLAYSRSSDEVDELRRLSILGRSGPPAYLALLRQWGVYDRLASSEEVVEIAEHPESGIRRRLAVGIFAGSRQLGTIWVQQGSSEFGPHAARALVGAARITAAHLVERRIRHSSVTPASGVAALLSGHARTLPGMPARVAAAPCAVAVFVVPDVVNSPRSEAIRDRNELRLQLDELAAIVTVHAASLRRDAVAEVIDARVCLVVPSLSASIATTRAVGQLLRTALVAARTHVDPDILCAVGPIVPSLDHARDSLNGALLALAAAGPNPQDLVQFDSSRPSLVIEAALHALDGRSDLTDTAGNGIALLHHDEPALAGTLLRYLDSGSRAADTAVAEGVHVTTIRHRLRRATELSGLDLDDADQRLAAQLELRQRLRRR